MRSHFRPNWFHFIWFSFKFWFLVCSISLKHASLCVCVQGLLYMENSNSPLGVTRISFGVCTFDWHDNFHPAITILKMKWKCLFDPNCTKKKNKNRFTFDVIGGIDVFNDNDTSPFGDIFITPSPSNNENNNHNSFSIPFCLDSHTLLLSFQLAFAAQVFYRKSFESLSVAHVGRIKMRKHGIDMSYQQLNEYCRITATGYGIEKHLCNYNSCITRNWSYHLRRAW